MLPPLNALRTFEAAARHLSFTRAAAELSVTQAAVSHQVKTLEAFLGFPLFRRAPRQLLLTDRGQLYGHALRDVFARLHEATARVRDTPGRELLTISVIPSFAARWLVPRLRQFQAKAPHIDVRVEPSREPANFASDGVDVGIRFGLGRYPGLRSWLLMRDEMFPVCAPAVAKRLRRPADLQRHVLLHDDANEGWREWLQAAKVKDVDWERGPIFTDASHLLDAAAQGQGVALGRRVLATAELAAGRLVRPFRQAMPLDRAYYLVCPERLVDDPRVSRFREWILTTAAREASSR
jgi:LysR family transcriptional regulator, glycine cleavage system transcriptional activator